MTQRVLTIPEIGLIAVTRVVLGVGLGLLLADKLSRKARKRAGRALLAVGVMSTIPIIANVMSKSHSALRESA